MGSPEGCLVHHAHTFWTFNLNTHTFTLCKLGHSINIFVFIVYTASYEYYNLPTLYLYLKKALCILIVFLQRMF